MVRFRNEGTWLSHVYWQGVLTKIATQVLYDYEKLIIY